MEKITIQGAPRYDVPFEIDLSKEGNFATIVGTMKMILEKEEMPEGQINSYITESESGDYNHVLEETAKLVNLKDTSGQYSIVRIHIHVAKKGEQQNDSFHYYGEDEIATVELKNRRRLCVGASGEIKIGYNNTTYKNKKALEVIKTDTELQEVAFHNNNWFAFDIFSGDDNDETLECHTIKEELQDIVIHTYDEAITTLEKIAHEHNQ